MYQLLGLASDGRDVRKSRLKAAAQVAESIALQLPLINNIYNRIAPSITPLAFSMSQSDTKRYPNGATQRRLTLLEEYALQLSFTDLPPPVAPKTLIEHAQRLTVRFEQWRESSTLEKADRRRELLAIVEGHEIVTHADPNESPKERSRMQRTWQSRRARQKEKDVQRAKKNAEKGKMPKLLQSRVQIADRLERNSTQRLLWIVLLNVKQQGESFSFIDYWCRSYTCIYNVDEEICQDSKEPLNLVAEKELLELEESNTWCEKLREKAAERPEILLQLKELEEELDEIIQQELHL